MCITCVKLIDKQNLLECNKSRKNECVCIFISPPFGSLLRFAGFFGSILLLKRVEVSYLLAHVNYLCIPSSYCYLSHDNNRSPHQTKMCKHTLRLRYLQWIMELATESRERAKISNTDFALFVLFIDQRFKHENILGPHFHLNGCELGAKLLVKKLANNGI